MTFNPLQLLPPGVLPFEALLLPGGEMQLQGLEREQDARVVAEALQRTPLVESRQDGAQWRVRGLLMGQTAQLYEFAVSEDGGESWSTQPFPELPGVPVQGGEELNTFHAVHWREGRIDLDPDPPEELLDALEDAVRAWHGVSHEDWGARHATALGEAQAPAPLARRVTVQLDGNGGQITFTPLETGAEYTLDGETWQPYRPVDGPGQGAGPLALTGGEEEETDGPHNPFDLLSSVFDLQRLSVEVYADGRVDVPDGDLSPERREQVAATLRGTLGAGDAAGWRANMRDLFGLEEPGHEDTGYPTGLRVELLRQLLDTDPELAAQALNPVAVTFDGQRWTELEADDEAEE